MKFFAAEFASLAENRTHFDAERVDSRYDGSEFISRTITILVAGWEDSWERVITLLEDITDRKKDRDNLEQIVEERTAELRESEKLFKQAARIASLGYYEWDMLADRCIFASDEYARILGASVNEILTKYHERDKDIMLVHPDDRGRVLEVLTNYDNSGESYDIEYRIVRPDGEERYIREMGDPIFDRQGQIIRTVGILQDITELTKTRKSLEQSETKLRLATQTAKLGYWHFDEVANEYLEVSDELAHIFGYTAEEYFRLFKSLDKDMELVHPEDREAVDKAYKLGIADGIDYRVFRKDGSVAHVREISKHIEDDNGKLVEAIGTIQDITELKEAKIEAENANLAKSEFLSSMSHELRTPLNAILGFAQVLDLNLEEPLSEKQGIAIDHIRKGGEHLLELINQVLDLSRIEVGKIDLSLELVNPAEVISDCLTVAKTMAESHSISVVDNTIGKTLPAVRADITRFKQVLLNLLSNAVKYNCDGGRLTIDAEVKSEQLLRISVRDTGAGISEKNQGKIFDAFDRLGKEVTEIEGTGIGLTISKQLMELMEGSIGFESETGKGSVFWVEFGIVEESVATRPDVGLRKQDVGLNKPLGEDDRTYCVLYVEDNPINVRLMQTIFRKLPNAELLIAADGEAGIEMANDSNPDIILMDIGLPGMDGVEARKVLGESPKTKDIPVIAVSAAAMEADIKRASEVGFYAYLTKPINIAETLKVVREALEGQE